MIGTEKLLDTLSTHLRNTIARGLSLATSLEHTEMGTVHMLYGMLDEKGAIGYEILKKVGLDSETIFRYLSLKQNKPSAKTGKTLVPELSEFAKYALEKAMLLAHEREHTYIGTEHLLYGILKSKDADITQLFEQSQLDKKDVIEQVEIILQSTSKFPEMEEVIETLENIQSAEPLPTQDPKSNKSSKPKNKRKKRDRKKAKAIDLFTIDLTSKAVQDDIDPVIGRNTEIERIIHILSRRTKNNPILIGEPGVGKTAIVEGLAKKIVQGDVPPHLQRKKILSLDLTMLIAGTIYRGEFEARLKQIIEEVADNPQYILFIDEVHNIIGTGSNQGTMDAANILKPALARGMLRCIGATTFNEYKKYIAADTALERRFQSVTVNEPNQAETEKIISGIKKYYEEFHDITIKPSAISAAVTLSSRYIQDQQLPDKAIDLIDEAAARARTQETSHPLYEEYQAKLKEHDTCVDNKRKAITKEKYKEASALKKEEKKLSGHIKKLEEKLYTHYQKNKPAITEKDIAEILGHRLEVKPDHLLINDIQRIQTIEKTLKNNVVGQDDAIQKVVTGLRHAYLRLDDSNKPLASFLFVGPSGVGKTELAKILAQELYHDEKALVRLDMSEFSESHSTAKLLGSPAGYVGYNDKNTILDIVRRRPHAIMLFDEFDKAHPDVKRLLLQILDEGALTDSNGKKTSFKNTIVVLTSNTGASLFTQKAFGFGTVTDEHSVSDDMQKQIISMLKAEMGPALMSRITHVCLFNPLVHTHIEQIIDEHIKNINKKLKTAQNISIALEKATLSQLAQDHYHKEFGARHTKQAIRELIEELVSEKISKRKSKRKKTYTLMHKNKNYHLR